MTEPLKPETIAATHGVASDRAFGAVAPPLHLSSTYAFEGYERPGRYDYGRAGNPNRDMLGDALAALEGGAGAIVTSSGMAAIDLILGQLSPADRVIAPHDCYGGTLRLLKARAARQQFQLTVVDLPLRFKLLARRSRCLVLIEHLLLRRRKLWPKPIDPAAHDLRHFPLAA